MAKTQGIRAGRAFVELGVSDKLTKGLRAAQRRLKAFGAGLRGIGQNITAVAGAALVPLAAAVRSFASSGDTLEKMARRTGISAEALSEMGFAAEQSGADLETLEKGVRTMQRTINDAERGLSTAQDALADIGLAYQTLRHLSPEEQFKAVAERLSGVTDASKRAALAQQLLGRAGTQLLPLMEDGAKGIEALQQQARNLGLTISTDMAKHAAFLTDTLNILRRVLKQVGVVIGDAIAPVVIKVAARITKIATTLISWVKANRELVVTFLKVGAIVASVGLSLIALGLGISLIGTALGGLASIVAGAAAALGAIGSVLGAILSPVGLVITAVVGLGAAILTMTDAGGDALQWLRDQFNTLKSRVFTVVRAISDALAAGEITLAAKVLWLALKEAWQEGVAVLNRAWLGAKRFFVTTAYEMWFGALAAAEQAWHALEVGWIEATAFMSKTWTSFTAGFQKAWNTAINWTSKRLLELQGLLDSSFDVDAAKAMADRDLADTNAEIDRQRDAALAARDRQRASERDQAAAVNEATLGEIGRMFDDAQARLGEQIDADLSATQSKLKQAREELAKAIEQTRSLRDRPDADAGPGRRRIDIEERLREFTDGIGAAVDKVRTTTLGTFNPLVVRQLAGTRTEEKIALATSQTARNTKHLLDVLRAGAVRFG